VVGDVLRGFERALVLQVRGDAGRPEGMVSDPRLDAGAARPPLDHPVGACCHMALPVSVPVLLGRQYRRLPFFHDVLGAAHGVGRVHLPRRGRLQASRTAFAARPGVASPWAR
jgi:hypothetical protein